MDERLEMAMGKRFPMFARSGQDGEDLTLYQAYGFECGPGWIPLLIEFGETVKRMDLHKVIILQVKEKFNDLRIYYSVEGPDADALDQYVDALEYKSQSICEICSKPIPDKRFRSVGPLCDHDGIDIHEITNKMMALIETKGVN